MLEQPWGSRAWQEAHFPAEQLATTGDTWGIRWRGVEKLRHASYLGLLRGVLQRPRPQHVLDVGCALCDFTRKAAALNPANDFWVMDTAVNAIAWVRQHWPQFVSRVGTLPDIPFDVQFDAVLCLEVLCYLERDERREAIRTIHSRLKPDGVLVFSGVLNAGERYHTEDEVMALLAEGFDIERVAYNHWRFYRHWIEGPLDRSETVLVGIRRQLEMSASAFEARPSARRSSERILRVLRGMRPFSDFVVAGASALVRALLSARLLAELAQRLSRPVRGDRKADEIIIVARKKQHDRLATRPRP
jgi:SAM-dependent methyltransferase